MPFVVAGCTVHTLPRVRAYIARMCTHVKHARARVYKIFYIPCVFFLYVRVRVVCVKCWGDWGPANFPGYTWGTTWGDHFMQKEALWI